MLVQMSSDTVSGLDPDSGKELFSWGGYKIKWAIPAPVKVNDKTLFLTGGYDAGSVMIELGKSGAKISAKEIFRLKSGAHIHAPVIHDRYIYGNFNENSNLKKRVERQGLTCLDLKGNTKWKTGDTPNLNRGNVILINDFMIIMDGDTGELYLAKASPSGFKQISKHKVLVGNRKNIWAPMAYSKRDCLLLEIKMK